jgi:hypothetical protein
MPNWRNFAKSKHSDCGVDDATYARCSLGLPEFSWYNIPKWELGI